MQWTRTKCAVRAPAGRPPQARTKAAPKPARAATANGTDNGQGLRSPAVRRERPRQGPEHRKAQPEPRPVEPTHMQVPEADAQPAMACRAVRLHETRRRPSGRVTVETANNAPTSISLRRGSAPGRVNPTRTSQANSHTWRVPGLLQGMRHHGLAAWTELCRGGYPCRLQHPCVAPRQSKTLVTGTETPLRRQAAGGPGSERGRSGKAGPGMQSTTKGPLGLAMQGPRKAPVTCVSGAKATRLKQGRSPDADIKATTAMRYTANQDLRRSLVTNDPGRLAQLSPQRSCVYVFQPRRPFLQRFSS